MKQSIYKILTWFLASVALALLFAYFQLYVAASFSQTAGKVVEWRCSKCGLINITGDGIYLPGQYIPFCRISHRVSCRGGLVLTNCLHPSPEVEVYYNDFIEYPRVYDYLICFSQMSIAGSIACLLVTGIIITSELNAVRLRNRHKRRMADEH